MQDIYPKFAILFQAFYTNSYTVTTIRILEPPPPSQFMQEFKKQLVAGILRYAFSYLQIDKKVITSTNIIT